MSEYTQSGARQGSASMPFTAGNITPIIEAAARTSNACGRAYLAWQDELLRFTSTRLQRDAEFSTNLLKCDKWADAARLQQSWVAETVEDYVSEANKLFELAANLTNDVTRTSGETARATTNEARRYAGAAGEAAGNMAEGVSRFTRSAGEQASSMTQQAGEQAASMADESRKAAEDTAAAARERGQKRR